RPEKEDAPPVYQEAEDIASFAKSNGKKLRGHTLIWHRGLPSWVLETLSGSPSPKRVSRLIEDHIRQVASYWSGRVVHWDVVNEPLAPEGAQLWRRHLGEQYIDEAFHAARSADPHALLILNQDLLEMDHPYQRKLRRELVELLGRLKSRGVPIDGVGIEGHLHAKHGFAASHYARMLDDIQAMGLKTLVTELDVWDEGLPAEAGQRDEMAARLVREFLDVNFANRGCMGMLTWSLTDAYSWLNTEPGKRR